MAGTRLKDINLALTLRKEDNDWEITDKEKAAIKVDNLFPCVSASQLTKGLNITTATIGSYLGPHTLLSI